LSSGNDRDCVAGVMERWSVGVMRFLHSGRLNGLPEDDEPFIVLY
jgi:hypothetical protein